MLLRASHTCLFTRPSVVVLSSRLFSTPAVNSAPLPKMSYYHHSSNIPLLYNTIGQQLEKLAATNPDHVCYVFKGEGNRRHTYKSFFDEVDSLAASLIAMGFQKNDRLGVWLPNTSENCALSYAASRIGVIKVDYSSNDILHSSSFHLFISR